MTQRQFVDFYIVNHHEVILSKTSHHVSTHEMSEKESFLEYVTSRLAKGTTFNDTDIHQYNICMLKEVTQLSEGLSFGELALLQNQPRSATIYCKSGICHFATLEK